MQQAPGPTQMRLPAGSIRLSPGPAPGAIGDDQDWDAETRDPGNLPSLVRSSARPKEGLPYWIVANDFIHSRVWIEPAPDGEVFRFVERDSRE